MPPYLLLVQYFVVDSEIATARAFHFVDFVEVGVEAGVSLPCVACDMTAAENRVTPLDGRARTTPRSERRVNRWAHQSAYNSPPPAPPPIFLDSHG